MPLELQNQYLHCKFSEKGAELQSLINAENKINYLWNGEKAIWGKYSPILFPIIGALKENTYYYNNKAYQLPRHGFARDMLFTVIKTNQNSLEFSLTHNDDTFINYPFQFELKVIYELNEQTLTCTYQVYNPSKDSLLFSLGAHPAFAAPLFENENFEDYQLHFNKDNELESYLIKDNLISNETKKLHLKDQCLSLRHSLFDEDALVFKHLKSNKISLKNNQNKYGLDFLFEGFDYFGIWSTPQGNFVCLEPWCGLADNIHHNQNIEKKEGIIRLESKSIFKRKWQVTIY